MFNFSDSLNDGKNQADDIEKMRKLFDQVFSELEKELSAFINHEVKLGHYIDFKTEDDEFEPSVFNAISAIGSLYANPFEKNIRKKTGYFKVTIEPKNSSSPSESLFKYKESKNVFPVDVLFEKNEIRCVSQEELVIAIKNLASDGQFHLKLRKFKNALSE